MRLHKGINNTTVEAFRWYNDLEFLPDFFYEDGDYVKICRKDITYIFDDREQAIAKLLA